MQDKANLPRYDIVTRVIQNTVGGKPKQVLSSCVLDIVIAH